jgi:hypothetical protein
LGGQQEKMKDTGTRYDGIGLLLLGLAAILLVGLTLAGGIHVQEANATCNTDCLARLDLSAQQSMGYAAWAMLVGTIVSAIIGAVSLWLIRENLIAAREVNKHAEKSALAAEQAVQAAIETAQITQRLGQAQVRAYLVVASANAHFDHLGTTTVTFEFMNSGQTPAREISVETRWWFETTAPTGGWAVLREPVRERKTRSDMPGQETRTGVSQALQYITDDMVQELKQPYRFLLDVTLICRDVFNIPLSETVSYEFEASAGEYPLGEYTLYRVHQ